MAHGLPQGPHGGQQLHIKGYTMEFVEKTVGQQGQMAIYLSRDGHATTPDQVALLVTAADGDKDRVKTTLAGDRFTASDDLEDAGSYTARIQAKVETTYVVGRFRFVR